MNSQEIESGNRLIAEFMCVPKCGRCKDCGGYQYSPAIIYKPSEMMYNESWDWMMPVLKKIRGLGSVDVVLSVGGKFVISWDDGTAYFKADVPDGDSNICYVWKGVVSFIKWYNRSYSADGGVLNND